MNIIILLVFVSAILVLGAVLLFFFSVQNRDLDHSEQLSLKPLEDDEHGIKTNRL